MFGFVDIFLTLLLFCKFQVMGHVNKANLETTLAQTF
jgi:hypothetical protein